jgi:hypothetical protein
MVDFLMEILNALVAIFAIMFIVGVIALMAGFMYQVVCNVLR